MGKTSVLFLFVLNFWMRTIRYIRWHNTKCTFTLKYACGHSESGAMLKEPRKDNKMLNTLHAYRGFDSPLSHPVTGLCIPGTPKWHSWQMRFSPSFQLRSRRGRWRNNRKRRWEHQETLLAETAETVLYISSLQTQLTGTTAISKKIPSNMY